MKMTKQPHQSVVKTEQLCRACSLTCKTLTSSVWESGLQDYQAWWRWKVSFMYAHNMCPHSTHTHISVSGVDSRSLWGIGPEWHTHLVCYPVGHCPISETKHQTPCKPCRTCAWNQMWYNLHLRATLFHNYTIEQQGVCLHWRLLVNNDLLVFEGRICKQNSPHTHSTTHTYETSLLADWLILQAR